ncbi:MAG TPA: hypothetical protein VGK24_21660 [Candidatus Angelobacter sp.]
MSKHGLTPIKLCTAIFCLFLMVGCVISPRRTVGGGTPTPTPTATPTPNPAATGKLYVSNAGSDSILRFDNAFTDNGNVTPAATISGGNTTLNSPGFITLDAAADRLYVINSNTLSILIYDNISTRNGNVAPQRTIAGASTNLIGPTDVSVDTVRNLLYVADDQNIFVFASASTATGNVAPARTLNTNFLGVVSSIFIDAANDRLYAADSAGNAIDIYDNASTLVTGAITASRTITGASTHLSNPGGVQVDGLGRLIVSNLLPGAPSITIYTNAAGANGDQAPVAEIVGNGTGMATPDQIVVDRTGTGTLYNADPIAARIAIFSSLSTANGNIAPSRSITGANTGLTAAGSPVGVALDNTR